jgi:hypothetical protein
MCLGVEFLRLKKSVLQWYKVIGLYEKLCIMIGMLKNNKINNKKNNKKKIKN